MYITLANIKGGVGKTTSAIHIASGLATIAKTVLIDSDAIRSSSKWNQRSEGKGLPFEVIGLAQMGSYERNEKPQYTVVDTEGNLGDEDFREAVAGSDLLVIPAVPETVATDGLTLTIQKLKALNNSKYKVLLTMVPSRPRSDGDELREMLISQGIPVFKTQIPRLSAFEKAAAAGIRVCDVKGNRNAKRAWEAYEAVVKEIIHG